MDFKQEFKSYCLLIKIKYCVKYSGRKIIKPEPFFLDNFISIATLDCCFNLEIKSIRNGVTIIDKKEHEKCDLTKKLYIDLKKYVGNVDCDCSMKEWNLKDIMSKLTINFLRNYDFDKIYILLEFDSWQILYCIVQDNLQETEDDEHVSNGYPFDFDREGYK